MSEAKQYARSLVGVFDLRAELAVALYRGVWF